MVGFVPHEGRLRKKCRADGTWVGTEGSCKRVYCPPIELMDNVEVGDTTTTQGSMKIEQQGKNKQIDKDKLRWNLVDGN